MDQFEFKEGKKNKAKVGEGTFGVVFQAFYKESKTPVALKKIKFGRREEGISFTALREVKALRDCRHENVMRLYDVFVHKECVYLVYEYCQFDLELLLRDSGIIITPADIKSYMQMLLRGLDYCHQNWILHRDLKPGNLLLSADGTLKLGDFGFARKFGSPNPRYSKQVVTLWYRSPELLFGSTAYGAGIDMWAVGCIFAEIMLRNPLFPGENEFNQLQLIIKCLGSPNTVCPEHYEKMKYLPNFIDFDDSPSGNLKPLFPAATGEGFKLLEALLHYNPTMRPTAKQALASPYFSESPAPTAAEDLPKTTWEEGKERSFFRVNNNNNADMIKRPNFTTAALSPSRDESVKRKIVFDD